MHTPLSTEVVYALLPSCHSLLLEPPVNSPGLRNWCLPFSALARPSLFSSTSVPYFLPCGPVLSFTPPAGCPPLLFSSPYRVRVSGPSQCHVLLEAPLFTLRYCVLTLCLSASVHIVVHILRLVLPNTLLPYLPQFCLNDGIA